MLNQFSRSGELDNECLLLGLRLIEPLLLIQEAVLCAIHYDKKSTDDLTAVPFSDLEIENQVGLKGLFFENRLALSSLIF